MRPSLVIPSVIGREVSVNILENAGCHGRGELRKNRKYKWEGWVKGKGTPILFSFPPPLSPFFFFLYCLPPWIFDNV